MTYQLERYSDTGERITVDGFSTGYLVEIERSNPDLKWRACVEFKEHFCKSRGEALAFIEREVAACFGDRALPLAA